MTLPGDYYWLRTDTLPRRIGGLFIDTDDTLYIRVSWCVVWLYVQRVVAQALAWLALWVWCELARGRGWAKMKGYRQVGLWERAA